MSEVVIVGGGISGLASAYFLAKRGLSSTIVEESPRLGGLLRTDTLLGCQLEAGADSYISTKPDVTLLAQEIPELGREIIGTNDAARRIFLVHDGKLVPYPAGMVMMVPADIRAALESDLFTPATKRAILQERFLKPIQRNEDVSVAEFVSDHFDDAILNQVVEPLLTGVYGGDAGKLSAKSVLPRFVEYERTRGSLIRAVRQEGREKAAANGSSMFLSFRNGMQSLAEHLIQHSRGSSKHMMCAATCVERTESGWRVRTEQGAIEARSVILCVPAHRAARLAEEAVPALAEELEQIPYSSAISVNLVYDRAAIEHPLDGFGFLVPRAERRRVAATTWVNTKFPQRVSEGKAAIRAFIVDEDANALANEADHGIVEIVRGELRRLMGIDAAPTGHIVARWQNAMPQYVVGHSARRERIRELVAQESGLFLAGNAYDGVGVPDCVRLARETVEQIAG